MKVEIHVRGAGQRIKARGRFEMDAVPTEGERVVFNDELTGWVRDVVWFLAERKVLLVIEVGELPDRLEGFVHDAS